MRIFTPEFAKTIPENAKSMFKGEIYEVFQWPQELFNGETATFEMVRRPDTVKIIAIKDNKIVVTHQRQPGMDWYYDLPSGRNDSPGESELAAAKRELREETGMQFREWRLIDVHQPFIKIDWLVYTFLATGFESQGPQELDGGEEIEVKEYTFDELKNLIHLGKALYIKDSDLDKYQNLEELLNAPSLYQYL